VVVMRVRVRLVDGAVEGAVLPEAVEVVGMRIVDLVVGQVADEMVVKAVTVDAGVVKEGDKVAEDAAAHGVCHASGAEGWKVVVQDEESEGT
jgi:hypothetical protein